MKRVGTLFGITVAIWSCGPVNAQVTLDLQPDYQEVYVGQTVSIELWAISETSATEYTSAMDICLLWDPTYMNPLSFTNAGAGYSWFQSGFLYPGDPNASLADGDAVWTAFAGPGNPAPIPPAGLKVTTFQFQALAGTPGTVFSIPTNIGPYTTVVYDGFIPNTPITGTIDPGAIVKIIPVATVYGNVNRQFYLGGAGMTGTLEFRDPDTLTVLHSQPITLDASGNYAATTVPVGTYDVALKLHNWLRQVLEDVVITDPSTSGVNFTVVNGDANGDNAVDLIDLNWIMVNFGQPGQVMGNLNWDGLVDILDMNINMVNFGLVGAP
ncbi:MAG: hypothetical protein HRF45_05505 [Fimbriimonadia bacterium]|jgi:hypothetical protein